MIPVKNGDDVLGTIQLPDHLIEQIERKLQWGDRVIIEIELPPEGIEGQIKITQGEE